MHTHTCNALLLKCAAACPPDAAMRWHASATWPAQLQTSLDSAFTPHAENGLPMLHVYVRFSEAADMSHASCVALEKAWQAQTGHAAQISRLQEVMHLEAPHTPSALDVHYVVETDPEAGWEDEIFKWYDQEHLPGLARVPGCLVARRYLNLDHSPRSFACYDLLNPAVLTSAPWLAVRGTAWSDICRPHFTNTLRTLFENKELTHHD